MKNAPQITIIALTICTIVLGIFTFKYYSLNKYVNECKNLKFEIGNKKIFRPVACDSAQEEATNYKAWMMYLEQMGLVNNNFEAASINIDTGDIRKLYNYAQLHQEVNHIAGVFGIYYDPKDSGYARNTIILYPAYADGRRVNAGDETTFQTYPRVKSIRNVDYGYIFTCHKK
jgi:hypothetical protein